MKGDEECRQVLKQRNMARMKSIQQNTRGNREYYKG
jgi:hypothetical protein